MPSILERQATYRERAAGTLERQAKYRERAPDTLERQASIASSVRPLLAAKQSIGKTQPAFVRRMNVQPSLRQSPSREQAFGQVVVAITPALG